MRPAPGVETPAVARNSAGPAAWFDPVTRTRVPTGIDIDKSSSRGPQFVGDFKVKCSYANLPSASTTSTADTEAVCECSIASVIELRRPTTAAKVEMDWNCVTISENAATRVEKAMAD